MADGVSEQEPPAQAEAALVLARRRAEANVPRHRFGIAYLALAALLGAAVGLFVVFVSDGGNGSGHHYVATRWSVWRPSETGTLGVRDIARHVSSGYLLSNGGQLVGVTAGPMEVPSVQGPIPVSALLISSGRAAVPQERIEVAYPEAGVFYQLCGKGDRCSIPGPATLKRGQLVSREALELALYTFHYLPQADHVLAFLPPVAGVAPTDPNFHRAIYLPRRALTTKLAAPLKVALPPGTTRITADRLTAGEGGTIDGLVAGRIFHYDFQQAPDQSAFVLLSPIEP